MKALKGDALLGNGAEMNRRVTERRYCAMGERLRCIKARWSDLNGRMR